jgi:ATP sulfurylase
MSAIKEKLIEKVFYCSECDVYVSESEIDCEHSLEKTTFTDIF